MKPVAPVLLKHPELGKIIAENHEVYNPLPAVRLKNVEGTVITRWALSMKERLQLLWSGSLYVQVHTYGGKLQAMRLDAKELNLPLAVDDADTPQPDVETQASRLEALAIAVHGKPFTELPVEVQRRMLDYDEEEHGPSNAETNPQS